MTHSLQNDLEAYCSSEYDVLKKVIVCEPQYMSIREAINETQKHFKEDINIEVAMKQHGQFIKVLEDQQVEVIKLPFHETLPEQVFTRDIGFTIGKTVYVAEMATEVRSGEEIILQSWLEEKHIPFYNLCKKQIEGGDVIIDRNRIFVGVSARTDKKSILQLQSLLPHYEIIPVPFIEKYLHLDCVFNILSPTEALVYPESLNKHELDFLRARYSLIEVTEEEQFTLGTNVLSIGNKKVISLPINQHVNKQLRERGFEVIEVDITEIIKSGGSFRCCTLPLLRDSSSIIKNAAV